MSHFNLIDEKWIPVRYQNGSRDELGIRDTLLRATEIATIEDPSPLVVASLHRFLLAVLYRALEGPTDFDQAKILFQKGLPTDAIMSYLEKWRDRFWLFDEKYPFMQLALFDQLEKRAWTALAAEHNADNSEILFDHIDVNNPGNITPMLATRWLIATQTFSISAGKSKLAHTNDSPSAKAAMFLPIGRDLQDTLLFSLVPQNCEVLSFDIPVWERGPESIDKLAKGIERSAYGYADLYTWHSRTILFDALSQVDGISRLAFASGIKYIPTSLDDPMFSYRIDEKNGKLPIRFRERGLWRDFDCLLPDSSGLAPKVIENSLRLCQLNNERFPVCVWALGQVNRDAKIVYWRMEKHKLPMNLLTNKYIRQEIKYILDEAVASSAAIESALEGIASLSITKGKRELLADKWKGKKWVPGDVSRFIGKTSIEKIPTILTGYWSMLENRFHEIILDFTLEAEADEILCKWLRFVREALQVTWDQYRASIAMTDAWAIRALVKSEGHITRKLQELEQQIQDLESMEKLA